MSQAAETNTTPANLPPPSPELILIMALLRALDAKEKRKKPKAGRQHTLDAVTAQIGRLVELPLTLQRETVPVSRAIAGAQATLATLGRQTAGH